MVPHAPALCRFDLCRVSAECLEEFERWREDAGLAEMLGHGLPSPEAARKFLYAFHEEERIAQAQAGLPAGQVSEIPSESEPLRALEQVNRELDQEIGRRCLFVEAVPGRLRGGERVCELAELRAGGKGPSGGRRKP
jgi:hypothetical protein